MKLGLGGCTRNSTNGLVCASYSQIASGRKHRHKHIAPHMHLAMVSIFFFGHMVSIVTVLTGRKEGCVSKVLCITPGCTLKICDVTCVQRQGVADIHVADEAFLKHQMSRAKVGALADI